MQWLAVKHGIDIVGKSFLIFHITSNEFHSSLKSKLFWSFNKSDLYSCTIKGVYKMV